MSQIDPVALRDVLGEWVRFAWLRWADTQPAPKPSWLVPWSQLPEPDKEADRQIGAAMVRLVLRLLEHTPDCRQLTDPAHECDCHLADRLAALQAFL